MILGIDPGYGRVGFAIISDDSREVLLDMGVIVTDAKESFPKRLSIIRDELGEIVEKYGIKESAIEQLFFSVNKKTAIDVAQARGVIVEQLFSKGLALFEYSPSQIKKSVAGHARADKLTIITMMEKLYNIQFQKKYDDAYDALAIAFTHKHSLLRHNSCYK